MSTNHTPGPWQLWTSNSWRRFMTECGSPICVPTVARSDGHPDLEVSEANARLIAAAPALLDALRAIYNRHNAETMAKARAAIAAATGEKT